MIESAPCPWAATCCVCRRCLDPGEGVLRRGHIGYVFCADVVACVRRVGLVMPQPVGLPTITVPTIVMPQPVQPPTLVSSEPRKRRRFRVFTRQN